MLSSPLKPMVPTATEKPFDSREYVFEFKWDGIRCLAFITCNELRLQSRNLRDMTHQFPELAEINHALMGCSAVLDGELCVLNGQGRPDFGRIKSRILAENTGAVRRLSARMPATYIVFDLLYYDARDLRREQLAERKEVLSRALTDSDRCRKNSFVEREGRKLFSAVQNLDEEGIVAKKLKSPYVHGRTKLWLKVKNLRQMCCVIGGLIPRSNPSLLVGAFDRRDRLHYLARIERGISAVQRNALLEILPEIKSDKSPFHNGPRSRNVTWIRPILVCRVSFLEFTCNGRLREATFKGFAPGRKPETCRLEN